MRSSILGAMWVLPACEKEASRTAYNEQSGDRVARLESAERLRARATITGAGIKGEVTFVELKGNLPQPSVEIEARVKGQVDILTPGVGAMEATTSRITLSPGPLSVFDADGSVIIVHGKPDQGITGPPGSEVSGGPRIACGVIELTPQD
jgi:hypothetical protein